MFFTLPKRRAVNGFFTDNDFENDKNTWNSMENEDVKDAIFERILNKWSVSRWSR